MAVDTSSKRFSFISFLKPYMPPVIIPDGTISQGDRQHLLRGYSGILWVTTISPATMTGTLSTNKTITGTLGAASKTITGTLNRQEG